MKSLLYAKKLLLCAAIVASCFLCPGSFLFAAMPETLAEAQDRLNQILGKAKNPARMVRFNIDDEIKTQPTSGDETVVVVDKGAEFNTNPIIQGESIVFYSNEVLERDVFNESPDGKRKLTRKVERTYSLKNRITLFAPNLWIVEQQIVSHSLPKYQGMTAAAGRVKWLDNGFEFHLTGTDSGYQPDGSTKPEVYTCLQKYLLEDNKKVRVEVVMQKYETAKSPENLDVLVPDFSKPTGKQIKYQRVSEPRNPASMSTN